MKCKLILFVTIVFIWDTQACVSIGSKFTCSEYLIPVVKTFNNYPDTIKYVGVSTRELRADFLFDSSEIRNDVKLSLDSSLTKIQQGLRITSKNKTITISGKTEEIGIKSFRLTAINPQDSTQHAMIVVIKILDNNKCYVRDDEF